MTDQFSRTELLLGTAGMEKLRGSHVAVFGIGGVGGYVTEALARSGIGTLTLVDADKVSLTNLNRQIIATHKTIGRSKVEAARERILEINPEAVIYPYEVFYGPQNADRFDFSEYDYVVDAIDTVTGKLELICQAKKAGVPVISSMGAGNKLDPTAFCVADIYETSVCPLARVMRRELKKRGIESLKVVYSKEKPIVPKKKITARDEAALIEAESGGKEERILQEASEKLDEGPAKLVPGSNAFVPSAAGLIIAGEIICDLTGSRPEY